MLQAPMLDGLSFDPFSLFDDGFSSTEVGVGRCHIAQAFVVALVVVMLDERFDLDPKIAGQEVILKQLAVSTIGGVVQPAQPILIIVPCSEAEAANAGSCSSGIELEVFIQNKDIGFIKVGQRVAVKLEAFNFTDYGMIEGVVDDISRDAIDQSQTPAGSTRDASGRPVQPGLVYSAKIRLVCGGADPERTALCDRVQPGLAAQAEIKTGRRRIIQYLLSPLRQTIDEAGRER